MKIEDGKIRLSFDHAEGLVAKGDKLTGFAIAGVATSIVFAAMGVNMMPKDLNEYSSGFVGLNIASIVVDNSGSIADLRAIAAEIWKQLPTYA